MFEYNGTTYLTQGDRDMAEIHHLQTELAYAKQKQEIVENNLAWANSRVETAEKQANELATKVESVEQTLAERTRERDNWFDRYISVQEFIQESIDGGEWDESELAEPFWERLAERLGLNIATEREITLTATWTLTIKTAKQSLSDFDFSVSVESDSGEVDVVSGEDWPEINISE